MSYVYLTTDESPTWRGQWLDGDAIGVDLSAATFTAKLVDGSGAVALTKTTGIVGTSAGLVTITWAAGELNIAPASYQLYLVARIAGSDRTFSPGRPPTITIAAAPA